MSTLWFDLEETIIDNFDKLPCIVNEDKIKEILNTIPHDRIGIFSFALWSEDDRKRFNCLIKPFLEHHFNIVIDPSLVPIKPELFASISSHRNAKTGLCMDMMDFGDFWGKEQTFMEWIRIEHTGTHILVDDLVENCSMTFPNCAIQMICIKG